MPLIVHVIDAFADKPFEGNPAAVVVLADGWLDESRMQAMAMEHNLAETAFIVPGHERDRWRLRWFTPAVEVPLCGHATLASGAHVLRDLYPELEAVTFETASGDLVVARDGERFTLALPARTLESWTPSAAVIEALGFEPVETVAGEYAVIVAPDAASLRALSVTQGSRAAEAVDGRRRGCLTVTARGDEGFDFISRFFAPGAGIPEDPVTGSSFCDLGPYWAGSLGKPALSGFQASGRGGRVGVRYDGGETVILTGGAVAYSRAEVLV